MINYPIKTPIEITPAAAEAAAQELIDMIQEKDCLEVLSGVYLQTTSALLSDAEGWDDDDPAREVIENIDPDSDAIWMITDNGIGPREMDIQDIADLIRGV